MTENVTAIEGLDKGGVNLDSPSIQLPPNVFSNARNVRFDDGAIRKFLGHQQIFNRADESLNGDIQAIEYWPSPIGAIYVVVADDTINLVRLGSTGNADVRTIPTTFSTSPTWNFTLFNGGYSIIINNTVDTPVHITANQGSQFDSLTATALPGWTSYRDTDTNPLVTSVSAGIIISAGSNLVAANLQERDTDNNVIRDLRGVVRSSDVAAAGQIPQNWNPYATGVNTADELLLADTGVITAMQSLQGKVFVFTGSSIHQVEVTGNGLRSIPITEQYGALNTQSVFEFDGRLLVVGSNDIYIFSGHPSSIESIADGRVRRYFYESLNPIHQTVFIQRNLQYDEIWVCYSNRQSSGGGANEALVFNYRDNTWTIRDMPANTADTTLGPIPGGGINGATITLGGSGDTGQFGLANAGTPEVQTLSVSHTAHARNSGIRQVQDLRFKGFVDSDDGFITEAQETFLLTLSGDAGPNTEAEVRTITFPGANFTFNSNTLNGGALFTLTDNNRTYNIPANALSGLSGTVEDTEYVAAIAAYIDSDNIAGFDWSATASDSVLTLTSDVPGPRAISAATLTHYTGSSVSVSGNSGDTDDGVTLTSVANNLSINRSYTSTGADTDQSTGETGITWDVESGTRSRDATIAGGTDALAINPNFESGRTRITFPANTSVSETINISWSIGQSSWRSGRDQDDQPYTWRFVGVNSSSLTFGGVTYTNASPNGRHFDGTQSFFDRTNPSGAGWPQRMWWRVESGSGLSFSGNNVGSAHSGSFPSSNSQSLLNSQNSIPVLFDMNVTPPTNQPTGNNQTGTGAATSGSASFTLSGTTGSSGCTISFFLGYIISNARRVGWAPTSLSGLDGTQTIYNYEADNTNTYPVTINSTTIAAGADNTRFASNQLSATNTYTITGSQTRRTWTFTNNRSEAAFPLQRDATNVVIRVAGTDYNLGSVASGSSASRTVVSGNTTGTYSFNVNGTTSQTISARNVTNDVNPFGGGSSSIQIDRFGDNNLTASNNTGTASDSTVAGIDVTQSSRTVYTGALSGSTLTSAVNRKQNVSGGNAGASFTVSADTSIIVISNGHPNNDGGRSSSTVNYNINGTNYTVTTDDGGGNGANIGAGYVTGPAFQSGDTANNLTGGLGANRGSLSAGDTVQITSAGTERSFLYERTRAGVTVYDTTFTNNNPYAVSLSSTSTGGSANLAASGGAVTRTGLSSSSWTVASTYINDTGTGAGYAGGFGVTVTNVPVSRLTSTTLANSQANRQAIGFSSPESDDGQTVFGNMTITNATSFARVVFSTGSGVVRGPAWQSGDSGLGLTAAQVAAATQVAAGTRTVASASSNGASLNGNSSGRVDVTREARTDYDISFVNNNNASVTLAANSTGGAQTYTSGQSRQVLNDGSSNAWTIGFGGTTVYTWRARKAANTGAASITYSGTTTNLTESYQTFATNVASPISVSGAYTVVNATSSAQTAPTIAQTNAGVGVYGISEADSPSIFLRFTHSSSGSDDHFVYDTAPFSGTDVNTPAEFAAELLTRLQDTDYFNASGPTNPDTDQFYYTRLNPAGTGLLLSRTTLGNIPDDHLSITGATEVFDSEYVETQFGGNITESITVQTQGAVGDAAPVLTFTQSEIGTVNVLLFGDFDSDTEAPNYTPDEKVARAVFTGLSNISGYTVALVDSDGDTDIVRITRTTSGGPNALITGEITDNADNIGLDSDNLNAIQVTAGVEPQSIEPMLTLYNADQYGSQEIVVDLNNVGTEDSIMTTAEIAAAIRLVLLSYDDLDSEEWVIGGTDSDITFTARCNPNRSQTGDSDYGIVDFVRGFRTGDPGFTDTDSGRLGRAVAGQWRYVFTSAGDITGNANIVGDSDIAVDTTPGVNMTPGRDGVIEVQFFGATPITVPLVNIPLDSIDDSLNTILNADGRVITSYNPTDRIYQVTLSDFNAAMADQISAIRHDPGYLISDTDSAVTITSNVDRNNDPFRPWGSATFNDAREFIVVAEDQKIYAMDLGYAFDTESYNAYVERKRLHIAPTKDVEKISGMFLDRTGGTAPLDIAIRTTGNASQDTDLATANYSQVLNEYKTDVRETGRLLNFRIGNTSTEEFIIEGVAVEIDKRGTR